MDPILEIRRLRADLFTYSLRAPGQPPRLVEDYFVSVEQCLRDAAEALHHYFDRVELHLADTPLGTVAVEHLRCPLRRQQLLQRLQRGLPTGARLSGPGFFRLHPDGEPGSLSLRAA